MEKFGFQLLILAISTVVSLFDYRLEERHRLDESTDFVLVKKSQGIELYERWYKMKSGQQAREVKAVCTINASVDAAISLLQNESKGTDWNTGTNAFKVVPQKENRWVNYIQYKIPWPMDNQDCVLLNTPHFFSDEFAVVSFRTIEDSAFPEVDGVHRIPYVKGKWVFQQTEGVIRSEYYITTTPSTILPRSITDPIIRHNLINTIDKFRSHLEN